MAENKKTVKISYGGKNFFLPPDEKIRQMVIDAGFPEGQPINSSEILKKRTLNQYLGFRGFIECGSRSAETGITALGWKYVNPKYLAKEADKKLDNLLLKEYSFSRVMKALNGELTLLTPTEFRKKYNPLVETVLKRKRNGDKPATLRERIEKLHIELFEDDAANKNLYHFISKKSVFIGKEDLGKVLRRRYFSGQDISFSMSKDNHVGDTLYKQALLGAKKISSNIPGQRSLNLDVDACFTDFVEKLTGISSLHFARSGYGKAKIFGRLGEHFTKFLLYWARALEDSLKNDFESREFYRYFPSIKYIHPEPEKRIAMLGYANSNFIKNTILHPDLLLGEGWAVEIKTGLVNPANSKLASMRKAYIDNPELGFVFKKPADRVWLPSCSQETLKNPEDAKYIEGATFVLHSPEKLVEKAVLVLESDGFPVLTYETFREYFEILMNNLDKKGFFDELRRAAPSLREPYSIMDIYDQAATQPHRLQPYSNLPKLEWYVDLIKTISELGRTLYEKQKKSPKIFTYIGGSSASSSQQISSISQKSNSKGQYGVFRKSIAKLEPASIVSYLESNSSIITDLLEDRQFFECFVEDELPAEKLKLDDIVFIDLECAAPSENRFSRIISMPFLVGMLHYEHGFAVNSYFCSTPEEEAPALFAFSDALKKARLAVTFNGKAYDYKILRERMISNYIRPELPAHLDILNVVKKFPKKSFPDNKLLTFERIIFGYKRKGDIPGDEIGQVYEDFLKTGNTDNVLRVLDHNSKDLLSTAALLAYVGQNKGRIIY